MQALGVRLDKTVKEWGGGGGSLLHVVTLTHKCDVHAGQNGRVRLECLFDSIKVRNVGFGTERTIMAQCMFEVSLYSLS